MDPGFDCHATLNQTVDEILVSGCDSRSVIHEATGLNKYLGAPTPQEDVMALGSCTCSSPSTVGYAAVEGLHRRLLAVNEGELLCEAVDEAFADLREELAFLLTRCEVRKVEVALAASGTDTELLALCLAHGTSKRCLCNVVVGPSEVGSGTPDAAAGRFFDALTPNGQQCQIGELIDSELGSRTRTRLVDIRRADGQMRDEVDIDEEVKAIAAREIASDHNVLLHIVAHSKTGVHAPSLRIVRELQHAHRGYLKVLVDAAQGRFSRRGLVKVLKEGYLVAMTGSKFYGGPPFSGCLLVPSSFHPSRLGMGALPLEMGRFFTAAQLPASWHVQRRTLPQTANLGLLYRWIAAAAEMRDYYSTPSTLRLRVLRAFETLVPEVFESSEYIRLITQPVPIYDDHVERLLESKTTVFSFALCDPTSQESAILNVERLHEIFRWLTIDISGLLPQASLDCRQSLARRYHIGQPVVLGRDPTSLPVLRVALSGVLISRVGADLELGSTAERRIEWLKSHLTGLKRKMELLIINHEHLLDAETLAGGR